jgi:hypothetical protein
VKKFLFRWVFTWTVILGIAILTDGCALPDKKKAFAAMAKQKVILLSSEQTIRKRCGSNVMTSRNIECLYDLDGNGAVYPDWLQRMKTLDAKIHSPYAQYDYSNPYGAIEKVGEREYKTLIERHQFTPTNTETPLIETIINYRPLAFLVISMRKTDGMPLFLSSVNVIQAGSWQPTGDYSDEVWEIANKEFPMATPGSPEVVNYIATEKQRIDSNNAAAAEAARQAKEIENKARKDQEERQRKQAEESRRQIEYHSSPQHKADDAASQIRMANMYLENAMAVINEEKEIGTISGYVNTGRLYNAGKEVKYFSEMIKAQWAIYKNNGGKAGSIQELIRSNLSANPSAAKTSP